MAYSEAVAEKIREALKMHKGLSERKMFGGIAFMLNGHMCCGVLEKNLVLRLGESAAAQALTKPHTRLMDFTGKPLKTMVYVSPPGYRSNHDLQAWLKQTIGHVRSLPPKKAKPTIEDRFFKAKGK